MNQVLFTVGFFIMFLTVGGVVLFGGHLLDTMDGRGSTRSVTRPVNPATNAVDSSP